MQHCAPSTAWLACTLHTRVAIGRASCTYEYCLPFGDVHKLVFSTVNGSMIRGVVPIDVRPESGDLSLGAMELVCCSFTPVALLSLYPLASDFPSHLEGLHTRRR